VSVHDGSSPNLDAHALLALFGSLLVVVFTAWLDTKALSAQIEALRAETRQGFAELRPGLHTEILS
jgi:hypothetical protein